MSLKVTLHVTSTAGMRRARSRGGWPGILTTPAARSSERNSMSLPKTLLTIVVCVLLFGLVPVFSQDTKDDPATVDQKVEPTRLDTPRVKPIDGPTPAELETSIQRGVDFLVGYQNEDGSWGQRDADVRPQHLRAGSGSSSRVQNGDDRPLYFRAHRKRE